MPLRRTLLIAASLFAALWCLMLIGGNRLIVSDGFEQSCATRAQWPPVVPAPSSWPREPADPRSMPVHDEQAERAREARMRGELRAQGALRVPDLARDANGNVLRAGPYMREAYRAFALEDAGG